jgi:hypothetical protein
MPRPILVLATALCCACGGSSSSPTAPPTPVPAASTTPAAGATGTTVGPAGGSVTSADGRAVLRVPAGALSADVLLSIGNGFAGVPDPFAASPIYDVLPANTRFAAPAELTIAASASEGPLGADPAALQVHGREGTSWRPVAALTQGGSYVLRWTGPSAPCPGPEHREFDFWLGNWNYVVNGNVVAPNTITRDATGCLIHEFYAGGSGVSVSFIGTDGAWYQTYVSAGPPIRIRGGLEGRRMTLYGPDRLTRFVWDPVSPDRVRYVVETTSDGGATWAEVAPNEYVRR